MLQNVLNNFMSSQQRNCWTGVSLCSIYLLLIFFQTLRAPLCWLALNRLKA